MSVRPCDRTLCGYAVQCFVGNFADANNAQRDRFNAERPGAHRIESDQFAREMECKDLLLAILGDAGSPFSALMVTRKHHSRSITLPFFRPAEA
jgi:hypothetical protein